MPSKLHVWGLCTVALAVICIHVTELRIRIHYRRILTRMTLVSVYLDANN
jgi:hypothetical protein